jgi:serine/threonine protein kinase
VAVKIVPFDPDNEELEAELSIMNKVKDGKVENLVHVKAIYFFEKQIPASKQGLSPQQSQMGIVMNWYEDGSLRSLLTRSQPHKMSSVCLNWNDKLQLALDVCNGLDKLHEMHLLHRDVKADNVLLKKQEDGRVRGTLCLDVSRLLRHITVGMTLFSGYLCDFGISASRESVNVRKQKGCVRTSVSQAFVNTSFASLQRRNAYLLCARTLLQGLIDVRFAPNYDNFFS